MANLFTYGSLMFPAVWRQLVSEPRKSKIAFLPHFSRRLIFLDTYPLLIPDADCIGIVGKIYCGMSDTDLARLDWFEGEIYQRLEVNVRVEHAWVRCQTYISKKEFSPLALQDSWRGDIFQQLQLPIFLARYCAKNLPAKD